MIQTECLLLGLWGGDWTGPFVVDFSDYISKNKNMMIFQCIRLESCTNHQFYQISLLSPPPPRISQSV